MVIDVTYAFSDAEREFEREENERERAESGLEDKENSIFERAELQRQGISLLRIGGAQGSRDCVQIQGAFDFSGPAH